MPAPRQRALTIPSDDWQEDQYTLDQPQSAFMTKLPLEIRRLVYEKALGGRVIHTGLIDGRLSARRCGSGEGCRCGNINTSEEQTLDLALPLLRTCRLM